MRPNTVFSDNRGKFVSKEFIDFCENFNMKVKAAATEAPWSNSICEHQHYHNRQYFKSEK